MHYRICFHATISNSCSDVKHLLTRIIHLVQQIPYYSGVLRFRTSGRYEREKGKKFFFFLPVSLIHEYIHKLSAFLTTPGASPTGTTVCSFTLTDFFLSCSIHLSIWFFFVSLTKCSVRWLRCRGARSHKNA